ncbi:MAG: hypothetical protein GY909_04355 [Oligoflexia bacterium]|nr:hypothetical protein [Oligoflexia bacterium]
MAEAEAEQQMDIQPPANKAGGAKNPLLTVLVLVNTIAMAGIAYFQFEMHKKMTAQSSIQDVVKAEMAKVNGEETKEGTGEAVEEDGILFPLEGFTANLAQGDGPRRFVRMNAVLKFSKDSKEEEFKSRKPQIRDTIISTLNSKRPEELLKLEGKNFLKEEIKAAINSFLVDGNVIDVYYVSFQIN